jgi:hypothetical protein
MNKQAQVEFLLHDKKAKRATGDSCLLTVMTNMSVFIIGLYWKLMVM